MWGQIQSITTCSKIPIQYSYDVYNDIKFKDYKYKILYGYYTKNRVFRLLNDSHFTNTKTFGVMHEMFNSCVKAKVLSTNVGHMLRFISIYKLNLGFEPS